MNYVNHLNGFFNKANADSRMKPNHISLYMMLFNNWNSNRFNNPTSIPKETIMKSSKINSNTTYYKCLKELQVFGFIEHVPTYNPHLNSNVIMIDLSDLGKEGLKMMKTNYTNFDQDEKNVLSKNSLPFEQVNELAYIIINNNKQKLNNLNMEIGTHSNFDNNKNLIFKKNSDLIGGPKKEEMLGEFADSKKNQTENGRQKSSAKKEEKYNNSEIPSLESVVEYFIFKLSTETEGNRFFNYYSGINWLIGGKAKMRDWKAVARNWIMNQGKYNFKKTNAQNTSNNLSAENNKNYDEPL